MATKPTKMLPTMRIRIAVCKKPDITRAALIKRFPSVHLSTLGAYMSDTRASLRAATLAGWKAPK